MENQRCDWPGRVRRLRRACPGRRFRKPLDLVQDLLDEFRSLARGEPGGRFVEPRRDEQLAHQLMRVASRRCLEEPIRQSSPPLPGDRINRQAARLLLGSPTVGDVVRPLIADEISNSAAHLPIGGEGQDELFIEPRGRPGLRDQARHHPQITGLNRIDVEEAEQPLLDDRARAQIDSRQEPAEHIDAWSRPRKVGGRAEHRFNRLHQSQVQSHPFFEAPLRAKPKLP